MDQYQRRGNFRRTFRTIVPYEFPQEKEWTNDWSIWISPEIRMDQWRSKFSESFSLDQYWSIECSSLDRWYGSQSHSRSHVCLVRGPSWTQMGSPIWRQTHCTGRASNQAKPSPCLPLHRLPFLPSFWHPTRPKNLERFLSWGLSKGASRLVLCGV